MKIAFGVCIALCLIGCTSVRVSPVASTARVTKVCIVNNPRVSVSDFVDVLRDGFDRHGIATSVVTGPTPSSCEVTLTYTALRSWDFAAYLSRAELRLWRNGRQIGSADYHLRSRGGLSLVKWRGTKSKMDPVIDRLLSSVYNTRPAGQDEDPAMDETDSQSNYETLGSSAQGTIGHGDAEYAPAPMNQAPAPGNESATSSGDVPFSSNSGAGQSTTITGRFTGKFVEMPTSASGAKKLNCEYDTGHGKTVWHTSFGSCPGTWEGQ